MFELFLYGGILLIMVAAFFFGGDAGAMAGILLLVFGIVVALIKFPGLSIILIVILIVLLIIRAIRRRIFTGLDEPSQDTGAGGVGGCLIAMLGILLMLPGAIAVFLILVLEGFDLLAAIAGLACMFIGGHVMRIGLNS